MSLSPEQIPTTISDRFPGLVERSKGHGMTFVDGVPVLFVIDNTQIKPSQGELQEEIAHYGFPLPKSRITARHLGFTASGDQILKIPSEFAGGHEAHNNVGGVHPEHLSVTEAIREKE